MTQFSAGSQPDDLMDPADDLGPYTDDPSDVDNGITDANLRQTLETYGMPSELAQQIQSGFVSKSAFTQKSQEAARAAQANAEWQNYFQQQQAIAQQGNQSQKDKFDDMLEALQSSDNTNARAVAELFSAFNQKQQRQVQQSLAPVHQMSQAQLIANKVKAAEPYMLDTYGKEFEKFAPQVYEYTARAQAAGQDIDPEIVFLKMFRKEAKQLELRQLGRKQRQEAERRNAGTLEGAVQTRSTQPAFSNVAPQKGGRTLTSGEIYARVMRDAEKARGARR